LTNMVGLIKQPGRDGSISPPKYNHQFLSIKMKHFELTSHSSTETHLFGKQIGRMAFPGDIFLLVGSLGTGKTCLAQGIARGLDIQEYTPSPSFVLIREFNGRLPMYHIDLYRLDYIEEIADLGLDDYLYGKGVCVIEWAEKGLSLISSEYLMIKIKHLGDNERHFEFIPCSRHYTEIINKLKGGKSECI